MTESQGNVTELLQRWNAGDREARDQLIPLVTTELNQIAASYFRREPQGHTLQPTAVVNECYLRLMERRQVNWKDRSHFFAFAAQTMRRILVDHARARKTAKRGQGLSSLTLSAVDQLADHKDLDLLTLEDALQTLATLDERQSRIVELRFFAGLSIKETAAALDLSEATVNRQWASARAWLHIQLKRS